MNIPARTYDRFGSAILPMCDRSRSISSLLLLCGFIACLLSSPVQAANLLPYGSGVGDSALPKSDDGVLNVSFAGQGPAGSTPQLTFYDKCYSSVYICNNGILSFLQGITSYASDPFPFSWELMAPLWCDADTTGNGGGTVWYRLEQDQTDLAQISSTITSQIPTAAGFQATFALIVTWDHVGYYPAKVDKLNTFQAVIATNGIQTYVIYLYPPNGINWLQTQASGSRYPLAGFNAGYAGNSSYYNLPLSGTVDLPGLPTQTNTSPGEPGQFIYRVDVPVITTVATAPVVGTVTASSSVTSWTVGSGSWTGDATTWKNGFNAVWNGPSRTVYGSKNVTASNLQLNSSGITFTNSTSIQFNQLRFTAPADQASFTGNSVVLPNAPDAINQGTLLIAYSSAVVARGTGTINGGTLHLRDSSRVDVYSADAITDQAALVFDGSGGGTGGKLDLRGFDATVGTINSTTSTGGLITNSGTAATLNVAGSGSSDFRGQIANGTGPVSLQKSGTGTLTLFATNLYSGPTVVHGGTLAVNGGTLGSTSSVEVQNGTLALKGTTLNSPMTVGTNLGTATLTLGTTTLTTASFSAGLEAGTTGNITLNSGTWNSPGGMVLANFGTASLTVTGGSLSTPTMILGHDGGTATVALNGGVVTTGEIARWSPASSISFGGGTLLAAADSSALLNGFTSGSAVLNAGGVTIDTNGYAVTLPAELTGTGGLTKAGAGRLILTGSSTFTGATLASAGELQVSGAISSSAVTMTGTACLSGTGQTGVVTLMDNASVEPGSVGAAGSLRTAGLTWNGGSMAFDLGADNTASDHLVLAGPLTGTALSKVFNFSGAAPGMIYDLITFTSTTLTAADFTASGATGVFLMSGNTLRFFVGAIADDAQYWRIQHFGQLEKTGMAADDADPDRDGLANLLEFALAQQPEKAGSAPLAGKIQDGYLEVTFMREDSSEPFAALKVGISTDLVNWTEIPVGAASSTNDGVIITVMENGAAPDSITVQIPSAGRTGLFTRISATAL